MLAVPEPPAWTGALFVIASVCVVFSTLWRRRETSEILTLDRQRGMLVVAATVSAVTVATLLSRAWFGTATLKAILLGFAVGYGCVLVLQLGRVQRRVGWPRRQRLLAGWFGVVVLAVVGVGTLARTYLVVLGMQPPLALLAGGMIVYNASKAAEGTHSK